MTWWPPPPRWSPSSPRPPARSRSLRRSGSCLSSDVGGISKRPTKVIFTVEDNDGRVLGRKEFVVRICSNPKRDKKVDHRDLQRASNHKCLSNLARIWVSNSSILYSLIWPSPYCFLVTKPNTAELNTLNRIRLNSHASSWFTHRCWSVIVMSPVMFWRSFRSRSGTSIRWLRPTCVPALGLPTRGTDLTRSLEWLTLAEGQSQKNDSPWHGLEASWTNHWWKWTHLFGKVCSTCAIWEKKWRWNKWKRGTQDFFQTSFAQKFLSLSLVPRIYFYLSIQRLVSVSPSK